MDPWGWASGSRWRGMRRVSAWDELGRCDAFPLEWDDEAGEFPRLPRRNHLERRLG